MIELAHNTFSKLCDSALKSYVKMKLIKYLQCYIHIYCTVSCMLCLAQTTTTCHDSQKCRELTTCALYLKEVNEFGYDIFGLRLVLTILDIHVQSSFLYQITCAHIHKHQVLVPHMVLHKATNCNKKNATCERYINSCYFTLLQFPVNICLLNLDAQLTN